MQKQYNWVDVFNIDMALAVSSDRSALINKIFHHSPYFTRAEIMDKINNITTLVSGFCFAIVTDDNADAPEFCEWYNMIIEKIYELIYGASDVSYLWRD